MKYLFPHGALIDKVKQSLKFDFFDYGIQGVLVDDNGIEISAKRAIDL